MSSARRVLASFAATIAVVAAFIAVPSVAMAAGPTCHEHKVPVSLIPGAPADLNISGDLCVPANGTPTAVQVLVPGSTYNRSYWNFPMRKYSYARATAERGYASFAIDRLNTGSSSTAPSPAGTIDTGAFTVHQVISALRAGKVGDIKFDKVVIAGHSLGSTITVQEAATYRDVDGVILTGFSHFVNPSFALDLAMLRVVAPPNPDDPSPSPHIRNQPPGEFTTPPGAREKYFYSPGNVDPAVVAMDEATKDIITAGELATFAEPVVGPSSNLIDVPVFFATAENDAIFHCGLTPCKDVETINSFESVRFTGAPSFEPFVLPGSGHDLNLARNAPTFFEAAGTWMDRHIGT